MVASLTFPHLAPLTSLLLCSDGRSRTRTRDLVSTKFRGLIIFRVWQQLLGTGTPQDRDAPQNLLFSDPKSIIDAESSHCSSGKLSLISQYSRYYISSCLICQLLINLQLITARLYLKSYIKFLHFQNSLDVYLSGDDNCPQQHPKQGLSVMA